MSKRYRGGILGVGFNPAYSGVWTLSQQFQGRGQGLWPATPGAPTIGTATLVTTTSATVAFTAPACTGVPAGVTGYQAVSTPGCITATGASSPVTVTGLTAGTAYTFQVRAQNTTGYGAYSASSNSVQARVPGAPTIGTATAGNATASVSFTAPACVGAPGSITSYTVTSTPGSITGTGASSPVTVSGLTNGTAYTFRAKATNVFGTGACSAASNSVTPVAPTCSTYTTPGTYSFVVPSGVTSVSMVGIAGGNGAGNFLTGGSRCGGSLRYRNGYTVTPGQTMTIVVGAGGLGGPPGTNGSASTVSVTAGQILNTAGGVCGGGGASGGNGNYGGGGAAGYTGAGGSGGGFNCGGSNGNSGAGGGAGGGGGAGTSSCGLITYYYGGGGGGGTGLYGSGSNGAGGVKANGGAGGGGGSSGVSGNGAGLNGGQGGAGGGGGGSGGAASDCCGFIAGYSGGAGGSGAVRIVWAGGSRGTPSFPSTNVGP